MTHHCQLRPQKEIYQPYLPLKSIGQAQKCCCDEQSVESEELSYLRTDDEIVREKSRLAMWWVRVEPSPA